MCSPIFSGLFYHREVAGAMTDIMLVDDEVLALEYPKNMVDWEKETAIMWWDVRRAGKRLWNF